MHRLHCASTLFFATVNRLISDRLSRTDSDSALPPYLRRLFANITHNVQTVEMNMHVMSFRDEYAPRYFGYKLLKPLFWVDSGSKEESINFALFLRLFGRQLNWCSIQRVASNRPSTSARGSFDRCFEHWI